MIVDREDIIPTERPVSPLTATAEVTTEEVVSDFLAVEHSLNNAIEGAVSFGFDKFTPDTNYVPQLDMTGYEGYADELQGAQSANEMVFLKGKIDAEVRARETFARATGWQKAAAMGTLIATDITMLFPVGGFAFKAFQAGNILKGAAHTAAVGAAIETGNEAILQANQITRTTEESLYNVAGATVLTGMLGGAAATLSRTEFDRMAKNFEDEVTTFSTDDQLSTVGAARVGTTPKQEEIKGLERTKKAFAKLPGFLKNPVWETATSESKVVREISEKLADQSLVRNKNTDFIASEASVEGRIKAYDTLRVPFYDAEKSLYARYVSRIKKDGVELNEKIGTSPDGSLTRKEFNEQVWWAGINNDTHVIPEVQELSQVARKSVFDPVLKRSEEVGIFEDVDAIDIKTADSWMKRMYDRDKIVNERPAFKKIVLDDLKQKQQISIEELERLKKVTDKTPEMKDQIKRLQARGKVLDAELDEIAEELIDRITNATTGRLPYGIRVEKPTRGGPPKVGLRGSARSRVWNIKDEKISDFLVKDVRAITESHLRTMAPDNEMMGKFGTLDFDVVKKQIQDDYNKLRSQKVKDKKTGELREKTKQELAKIDKQLKADIRNTQGMWEKLRGIYAQPDDYAAPQHVLERSALALNFVRLLGDVVMSSFPDIGRHIMVNGFGKTYDGLVRGLIKDTKGFKASAAEMREMGLALDITNSMTALRRVNMDEYMPVTGKIDEALNKTSNAFALGTGINHWNAAQKTFAGVVTQNRMLDGIMQYAKTGKLGKKEIENLAAHGIGRDEAIKISDQFKRFGDDRGAIKVANAREWDDSVIRNKFRDAIRKQVDEIIVTPGLDKPLWMSRPGWKTIGQFKSFSFASTQRVLLSGMQQADARTFAGISTMIALGMVTYAWKTRLSGRPLSDDPRIWVSEGVDRSGITGFFMDANNVVEKLTRGSIGVNSLMGGPPMSRYASRNGVGALLGPSFGMAKDMFQVTGAAFSGDVKQSDTHALRKLIPGQNLPYVRGLFDKAEEGIAGTFGLKQEIRDDAINNR